MTSESGPRKKELSLSEEEEQKLHSLLRASVDSFIENGLDEHGGAGKEVIDAGFPELADDEWSRESARFLRSLDPEELERQVSDEARRGDPTLLLAFLGTALAESETFFGIEDYRFAEDTRPHEYIDRQFPELHELFNKLVSLSPQFGKEYTRDDFMELLREKRAGLERAAELTHLSKRGENELAFLRRFEEGVSEPGDVMILERMIQSEGSLDGGIMGVDILTMLRGEPNSREVLRKRLERFLLWHRFSPSVVGDLLGGNRDKIES